MDKASIEKSGIWSQGDVSEMPASTHWHQLMIRNGRPVRAKQQSQILTILGADSLINIETKMLRKSPGDLKNRGGPFPCYVKNYLEAYLHGSVVSCHR